MKFSNNDLKQIKKSILESAEIEDLNYLFTIGSIMPVLVYSSGQIIDKTDMSSLVGCSALASFNGRDIIIMIVDFDSTKPQVIKTFFHEAVHAVSTALNPSKDHVFTGGVVEEIYADCLSEFMFQLLKDCWKNKKTKNLFNRTIKG